MYIEASYPRKPGEIARLVVTVPNYGNQSCLSFYYHMYGTSAGTLNVYSGNIKVFSATGNQGDDWLIMETNLYLDRAVSKTCLADIHLLTLAGSCQFNKLLLIMRVMLTSPLRVGASTVTMNLYSEKMNALLR